MLHEKRCNGSLMIATRYDLYSLTSYKTKLFKRIQLGRQRSKVALRVYSLLLWKPS